MRRTRWTRLGGAFPAVSAGGGGGGGGEAPVLAGASQWAYQTGTSAPAINDNGFWNGQTGGENRTGGVFTIASLLSEIPGLQVPAALAAVPNAQVTRAHDATSWATAFMVAERILGAPVPGETRRFRYYCACLMADSLGAGSQGALEHGIETAETGGGDGLNPYRVPRNDGTWWPAYREIGTSSAPQRYIADGVILPKWAFLRHHLDVTYGASTYTPTIRIFAPDDVTLLAETADYWNYFAGNPADLLVGKNFAYAPQDHSRFRVGNNGPTGNFPAENIAQGMPMFAVTAFAYTTNGADPGAYIHGNG